MRGLPVSYVGPKVDLAFEALESHHGARDHDVTWFEDIDNISLHRLRGVVAFAPFEFVGDEVWGACDIARNLHPDATLMLIDSGGNRSSRMMAAHVAKGACHARALVYRPGGSCESPTEVLDAIERSRQTAARVDVVGGDRTATESAHDLRDVMGQSERFARLLYAAATMSWARYDDLAYRTSYGKGTVRNIVSDIGHHLRKVGLVEPDASWGIPRFAQLVADHRSFIRVAGRCHCRIRLGEGPPTA